MAAHRPSAFARNLRRIRTERGLSQESLAARLGVTREQISHLERGKTRSPGADTIKRVADALGVAVADLLEEQLESADGSRLLDEFRASPYYTALRPTDEELQWLARVARDIGGLGIAPTPEALVGLLKARRGTL